jgi:hypothetical protein
MVKAKAAPKTFRRRTRALPQTATKAETDMAARLRTLEPGTKRHDVLSTAIDFKRSWFRLARHLAEVRDDVLFAEWGYKSFEAYAQRELHLRRETTQKLVRSYDFLNAHERPTLRAVSDADGGSETDVVPLPSYQALDILAEARQNPYLSDDDYRDLRDRVFKEDPPPAQLRKTIKERAPVPAPETETEPAARLRKCLNLAERLYGLLLEEDVPPTITHSVEQAVGGLRRLLDE